MSKKVYRYYSFMLGLSFPLMFPFISWTIFHGYISNFLIRFIPALLLGCLFYKFPFTALSAKQRSIITGALVYFLFEFISYLMFYDVFWGLLEDCVCTQISSTWALSISVFSSCIQYLMYKNA